MAYLETERYNEVSAQRKLSIVSWHTWKLNYTMRCPLSANFQSFLFSSEKEEEWKEKRKEGKEKEEGEGFNI